MNVPSRIEIGQRYFFDKKLGSFGASWPWWLIVTAIVESNQVVVVGIINGSYDDEPIHTYTMDSLYGPAITQKANMLAWLNSSLQRTDIDYPLNEPVDPSNPGDIANFSMDVINIVTRLRLRKSADGKWSIK